MAGLAVNEAMRIFGADCIGPNELAVVFSSDPSRGEITEVPFDRDLLMRAADEGMMLVLRVPRDAADASLTALALATRSPGRDATAGSEPWFARETFAVTETCRLGWALVDKHPPSDTTNLSYVEQDEELARRSESFGAALRRRSAVEILYDTLVYAAARGERLLESQWDWSSTMTLD